MHVGTFASIIIFVVVIVLAFFIAFAAGRHIHKRNVSRATEKEH